MTPTEAQTEPQVLENSSEPVPPDSEFTLLDFVVLLLAHKRFVMRFVLGAFVLGVIVALVWPVSYESKVVLLPPSQGPGSGSSVLGQLGGLGALASLAGGGLLKNPTDMYVSLLTSRTVEDAMIQRFDLMKEYRVKRMVDARKALEQHTAVVPGAKDGLIRLTLEDRDPKRAAELANGYVEEFRRLSASLAITEAARRRLFFQQEVQQAKDSLTGAEDAMTKTEQSTGVLQIDSQARALIEAAAVLRAQVVAKQVQIEGMRSFAAEDNPNLILAKQELAALQEQLDKVAGSHTDAGSDINMSKGRVTQAGMEYLRRYRDLKYQETVYELLAKEFEIAKLDEAREGSIIQVVDAPVVPDKKSSPHRLLIVVGSTVSAFFLAVFWLLIRRQFDLASGLPGNRRRLHMIQTLWKSRRQTA